MTPTRDKGAAREGAAPGSGVRGTAYLLCIEAPGLHVTGNRYARHFIGWTAGSTGDALIEHRVGTGAPLTRAAVERGLELMLVREWSDATPEDAQALRDQGRSPRLCPTCRAAK